MSRTRKIAQITALSATMFLFASACSPQPVEEPVEETDASFTAGERPVNEQVQQIHDALPEEIKERGSLNVAMSPGMAPLNYPDEASGDLIGFNPDIAHQLGEIMGLEVKLHAADNSQMLPGMEAGRYDINVSNQAVTEERLEVVDFVEYYFSDSRLAVQAGNPNDLSVDNFCGMTIGVSIGSFQQTEVLPGRSDECEENGEEPITPESFPNQQDGIFALTSGRIDGLAGDGPVILYAVDQESGIEELGSLTSGSNLGIGVTKDSGLLDPVQMAMQELMDNGNYASTLDQYGMSDVSLDEAKVQTE
ncbi:transporter substrate-binding domain-containing protein [Brevibacterium yomogidense]|uniref:transporter substrate-binding domain-containing protein n=1 Tax=Brevibacterium yomogidense TaxID=946573 RepID=UPI0018E03656|nr:transporter substrate-binding domain-containing protein [Brevibacterium yomogidense]